MKGATDTLFNAMILAKQNDTPVSLTIEVAGQLLGELLTAKTEIEQLRKSEEE
jgi:hypothetical protein